MAIALLLDPRNTPAGTIGINPSFGGGGGTTIITQTLMVPYYVGPTEVFTVPRYSQALYSVFIDVQGLLVLDGVLVEVD